MHSGDPAFTEPRGYPIQVAFGLTDRMQLVIGGARSGRSHRLGCSDQEEGRGGVFGEDIDRCLERRFRQVGTVERDKAT